MGVHFGNRIFPTPTTTVVTDGLVGYWDYYPGSGSIWYDISGKGNHMRLFNSPTYNGGTDRSFTFNGSNQYGAATWDYINYPFGSQAFTLSCFFTQTSGSSVNLFGIGGNIWNGGRACLQGGSTTTIGCETRNGAFAQVTTSGAGTWNQIVFSVPEGASNTVAASIYLNGSFVQTTTNTFAVNIEQCDCVIGTIPGATFTAWWPGKIGSPMLYNRAITASEVTQNWNYLRGRYGL
jgi:hypothetical protein